MRSWREALLVYARPRVFAMIWLGCSAGLPFLLIGPTLSGWQRDVGVERSLIGFFSWIGGPGSNNRRHKGKDSQ